MNAMHRFHTRPAVFMSSVVAGRPRLFFLNQMELSMIFRTDKPASIASAHSARADMTAWIDPRSRVTATSAKQARADMSDSKVPVSAQVARAAFVARITNPKE